MKNVKHLNSTAQRNNRLFHISTHNTLKQKIAFKRIFNAFLNGVQRNSIQPVQYCIRYP